MRFLSSLRSHRRLGHWAPVSRPSVIVMEGVEQHGCRESCDGPWMALRSVPLQWRWSEGTLRAAKGRMPGWPSFWLLFLAKQEKVTRRERRDLPVGPRKARRHRTNLTPQVPR
jgi:hypothetical protein